MLFRRRIDFIREALPKFAEEPRLTTRLRHHLATMLFSQARKNTALRCYNVYGLQRFSSFRGDAVSIRGTAVAVVMGDGVLVCSEGHMARTLRSRQVEARIALPSSET